MTDQWLDLRIGACSVGAKNIRIYELVDPSRRDLPPFEAGAHIQVRVGSEIRRYSLANNPVERHRYMIGVLRDSKSRGGSRRIHETWALGHKVTVSAPINHFPLSVTARRHLLIAGGIGIAPILAMARHLVGTAADFSLYYCAREALAAAFLPDLLQVVPDSRLNLVFDGGDPKRGLDVAALLETFEPGRHVYVCGPSGLIQTVRSAAAHWAADHVHYEIFATGATSARDAASFQVVLARSGGSYEVPADRSILSVLEENGHGPNALCREGYCGTCLVPVLCGTPDHRDSVLTDEEKAANDLMAICCSRAVGEKLVLDI